MLAPGSFAPGETVCLPSSNISGLVRPWSHSATSGTVRRTAEDG